jgi:signal transduction histidine kinase
MQLVNKAEGCFEPEDQTVLEIVAGVCAMSMHNAELARRAQRTEALGYVAGFAHDIYNKLASLVMGLPTLRLLLDDAFAQRRTAALEKAVARQREEAFSLVEWMETDADLVHRYARFIARLAGDLPLDTRFEPCDLVETAQAQVLQLERKAREYAVTLRLESGTPVFCTHDRLLVGSAIYNLIQNALPETRGGTVTVAVWDEGSGATLEVCDTGRGMPADLLNRILDGDPISTKAGGSGIGTLIVKKVAEIHQGVLEGESALGLGTTFRLRFPPVRREECGQLREMCSAGSK